MNKTGLIFGRCIRLTREIFSQPAFDEFRGGEILPGEHIKSDEQLDNHIRQHVESAYHPCGTCKMGSVDDRNSVVDPQCRVIGVSGLRVVGFLHFPVYHQWQYQWPHYHGG